MTPAEATEYTLIVGLGRPLGGDDTVGLAVAEHLVSMGIRAVQATDTAFLVDLFLGVSRVLVIDAVVGAGAPGDIVVLTEQDLFTEGGRMPVSTHAMSVPAAVKLARALGSEAEIRILGVVIAPPNGATLQMSEAVRAAIEPAARRTMELLRDKPPKT